MGGGAIKDPTTNISITKRLEKIEYEIVKKYAINILNSNDFECETVLELPGKENFGDLDILYISKNNIDFREFIKLNFKCKDNKHIVSNGDVMSFAFHCDELLNQDIYFQIDFIKTQSKEHLDLSRFYFSYGDIGSILGRIFNYYGIKFGDRGLWCEVLESTAYPEKKFDVRNTIGKIVFTTNLKKICEIAGLDYDFWQNEIPLMTQKSDYNKIFDWIMSSKLFSRNIFKVLNSDHRARFNLRPFYKQFVEYIGIDEIKNASSENSEIGSSKTNMQVELINLFGKNKELENIITNKKISDERKEKFSGLQIIEYYNNMCNVLLKGKEVGEKVSLFKKYCCDLIQNENFDVFLDTHSKDEINIFIQDFIKKN